MSTSIYRRRGHIDIPSHYIHPTMAFDVMFERLNSRATLVTGSFHPIHQPHRHTAIHARILTFPEFKVGYFTNIRVVDSRFPEIAHIIGPEQDYHETFFKEMIRKLSPNGIDDLRFKSFKKLDDSDKLDKLDNLEIPRALRITTSNRDRPYEVFKTTFLIWHRVARERVYERMLKIAFPDLLFDIIETIRSNRFRRDLDLIDREEKETNLLTRFKIQRSANGWSFRVILENLENLERENWSNIRDGL